jgi:hypothetical protein
MGANHPYPNKTEAGATIATYVAALTINNGAGAVLQITNTHVSSTMYYKIDLYLTDDPACIPIVIKSETSIAANTTLAVNSDVNIPFFKVVVSVKQNSAAGTYQVDALQY